MRVATALCVAVALLPSVASAQFSVNWEGKWDIYAPIDGVRIGEYYDFATDEAGDVYLYGTTSTGSEVARKFDPTGQFLGDLFLTSWRGTQTISVKDGLLLAAGWSGLFFYSTTSFFASPVSSISSGATEAIVGPEGNIYVSRDNRVEKLAPDGSMITRWGAQGTEPGFFVATPQNLHFNELGRLLVRDEGSTRMQEFQLSGHYVRVMNFQSPFPTAIGRLGMDFDPQTGFYYVADRQGHRVLVFASNGSLLGSFGPQPGLNDGWFDTPIDVAVGTSNRIYVLDAGNLRIQYFTLTSLPVAVKATTWGRIKSMYTEDGQ